jgi:hypothetical protein
LKRLSGSRFEACSASGRTRYEGRHACNRAPAHEQLHGGPYLELFARRPRERWTTLPPTGRSQLHAASACESSTSARRITPPQGGA